MANDLVLARGNRATATIKFSGISTSSEEDKARQGKMVERAKDRTAEELEIFKKLESVSGLIQTIKAIGDSVKGVSLCFLSVDDLSSLTLRSAQLHPAAEAIWNAVDVIFEVRMRSSP